MRIYIHMITYFGVNLIKLWKQDLAISFVWAGVSIHLIQDASLNHATTKPYTGIPFKMFMDAHQGLFATKGAASAIFLKIQKI